MLCLIYTYIQCLVVLQVVILNGMLFEMWFLLRHAVTVSKFNGLYCSSGPWQPICEWSDWVMQVYKHGTRNGAKMLN